MTPASSRCLPAIARALTLLACLAAPAWLAGSAVAQVTLKRGAVVYQGSASNTSAPASIDETKVRDATKEWKKIQADGIDVDSAQGKQLIT